MKNTALYLLGGAALLYFVSRANVLANLVFVPRGLSFVGAGGIKIILGVQNPTSNALTLRSLAGSLIVNGNTFGNISNFSSLLIAGNSETPVPLTFSPNIFGIASDIINAIQDGSTAITASLKGSANVDGTAVPINIIFQ